LAFLHIESLSISFGGIKALDKVNLRLEEGEVHALIGPNGAGKTSLFNCLSGIYRPSEGKIFFRNEEITGMLPCQVAQRGIARTFQNIELSPNMTVLDNILLGRHIRNKTGVLSRICFIPKVRRQEIEAREKAEEVIDFLELQAWRWALVASLPHGIRKKVELARALVMKPDLLLLDEPSAGMNLEEREDLIFWIQDIKEEMKITILLVEHAIQMVMEISDRITVLDFGRVIASGSPREIQQNPEVIEAYLGKERSLA
jgi:branched-chain amino acid transport system ATP-binding protein